MEIILLRHGQPVLPPLHKISASEFYEWVNMYNLSGLDASSKPAIETVNIAKKCNAIVCSQLPRSIESAKALTINNITFCHALFNEASLPVASWVFLKLSPKAWAVIFRIFWFFGYSYNSESYKDTKSRAAEAANILVDLAEKHECVLYVGHGIYNRLLANELKAKGWSGPSNPGSRHWSFGIYTCKQTRTL